jgi:hypothetical protein
MSIEIGRSDQATLGTKGGAVNVGDEIILSKWSVFDDPPLMPKHFAYRSRVCPVIKRLVLREKKVQTLESILKIDKIDM